MKPLMGALTMMIASGAIHAGPFGLKMGTPLFMLEEDTSAPRAYPSAWLDDAPQYKDVSVKVPKPNDAFRFYSVKGTEKSGVCEVTGFGKEMWSGTELLSEFDRIAKLLADKYGKGERTEKLPKDPAKKPDTGAPERSIMRELSNGERAVKVDWDLRDGGRRDGVARIELRVNVPGGTGYLTVRYELANFSECQRKTPPNNQGL